jgi:hypothetical protein
MCWQLIAVVAHPIITLQILVCTVRRLIITQTIVLSSIQKNLLLFALIVLRVGMAHPSLLELLWLLLLFLLLPFQFLSHPPLLHLGCRLAILDGFGLRCHHNSRIATLLVIY